MSDAKIRKLENELKDVQRKLEELRRLALVSISNTTGNVNLEEINEYIQMLQDKGLTEENIDINGGTVNLVKSSVKVIELINDELLTMNYQLPWYIFELTSLGIERHRLLNSVHPTIYDTPSTFLRDIAGSLSILSIQNIQFEVPVKIGFYEMVFIDNDDSVILTIDDFQATISKSTINNANVIPETLSIFFDNVTKQAYLKYIVVNNTDYVINTVAFTKMITSQTWTPDRLRLHLCLLPDGLDELAAYEKTFLLEDGKRIAKIGFEKIVDDIEELNIGIANSASGIMAMAQISDLSNSTVTTKNVSISISGGSAFTGIKNFGQVFTSDEQPIYLPRFLPYVKAARNLSRITESHSEYYVYTPGVPQYEIITDGDSPTIRQYREQVLYLNISGSLVNFSDPTGLVSHKFPKYNSKSIITFTEEISTISESVPLELECVLQTSNKNCIKYYWEAIVDDQVFPILGYVQIGDIKSNGDTLSVGSTTDQFIICFPVTPISQEESVLKIRCRRVFSGLMSFVASCRRSNLAGSSETFTIPDFGSVSFPNVTISVGPITMSYATIITNGIASSGYRGESSPQLVTDLELDSSEWTINLETVVGNDFAAPVVQYYKESQKPTQNLPTYDVYYDQVSYVKYSDLVATDSNNNFYYRRSTHRYPCPGVTFYRAVTVINYLDSDLRTSTGYLITTVNDGPPAYAKRAKNRGIPLVDAARYVAINALESDHVGFRTINPLADTVSGVSFSFANLERVSDVSWASFEPRDFSELMTSEPDINDSITEGYCPVLLTDDFGTSSVDIGVPVTSEISSSTLSLIDFDTIVELWYPTGVTSLQNITSQLSKVGFLLWSCFKYQTDLESRIANVEDRLLLVEQSISDIISALEDIYSILDSLTSTGENLGFFTRLGLAIGDVLTMVYPVAGMIVTGVATISAGIQIGVASDFESGVLGILYGSAITYLGLSSFSQKLNEKYSLPSSGVLDMTNNDKIQDDPFITYVNVSSGTKRKPIKVSSSVSDKGVSTTSFHDYGEIVDNVRPVNSEISVIAPIVANVGTTIGDRIISWTDNPIFESKNFSELMMSYDYLIESLIELGSPSLKNTSALTATSFNILSHGVNGLYVNDEPENTLESFYGVTQLQLERLLCNLTPYLLTYTTLSTLFPYPTTLTCATHTTVPLHSGGTMKQAVTNTIKVDRSYSTYEMLDICLSSQAITSESVLEAVNFTLA